MFDANNEPLLPGTQVTTPRGHGQVSSLNYSNNTVDVHINYDTFTFPSNEVISVKAGTIIGIDKLNTGGNND